MAITKRIIKRKVRAPKKHPLTIAETEAMVNRMGAILEAGHGDDEDARAYMKAHASLQVRRLQSIVATAHETRSWKHMEGCYAQAMLLYVFAGVMYEEASEPFMEDRAYDKLGRWLVKRFDKLPRHFCNWYNITAMGLEAGSALGTEADNEIRWMLYVHTGVWLKDKKYDKSGPLPRSAKRTVKKRPRNTGKPTRKAVRRIKRG